MKNLYQEVAQASRLDLPMKSTNFLANCKNLLLEMEPFLISNNCSFNRLICHVASCHEENLKAISITYHSNMEFTRRLIIDVYKIVYLGHMFVDYYR